MKLSLSYFLFCIIFSTTYSYRIFHNGRMRGGNLGQPKQNILYKEARNFTRWLTQRLDHFDNENLATWQQRYYVNDDYVSSSRNVAFLMLGGESEATDDWMTNGAWTDFAKNFSAILFQLEHRFYGQSRPTEHLSVENLKFLTSQQALADIAAFITEINKSYQLSPVKWIVFGGSYSGSLAAWARLKYPDLIQGAVSTSGPLLAIVDFQDYYQVVADDLQAVSAECYSAVQKGTAQIATFLQDRVGQSAFSTLFKLCEPIEESVNYNNDIANLYDNLATNFAGIAQYNKDNRLSTRGTKLGNITLDTVCDIMTNTSEQSEITRLAYFNSLMLNATNQNCLDFNYSNMITGIRNISWDSPWAEGGRQWKFQTCNEFAFYQSSTKQPQIFGNMFPVEFYLQQCVDSFGSEFNASYVSNAVDSTNIDYGALDIKVDNVVFVHGSVDPWHTLGVTQTVSEGAPAIFINGTAHCADMYPARDEDPPQLQAARKQIGQYISKWLSM